MADAEKAIQCGADDRSAEADRGGSSWSGSDPQGRDQYMSFRAMHQAWRRLSLPDGILQRRHRQPCTQRSVQFTGRSQMTRQRHPAAIVRQPCVRCARHITRLSRNYSSALQCIGSSASGVLLVRASSSNVSEKSHSRWTKGTDAAQAFKASTRYIRINQRSVPNLGRIGSGNRRLRGVILRSARNPCSTRALG
jgi:hypothetical protein